MAGEESTTSRYTRTNNVADPDDLGQIFVNKNNLHKNDLSLLLCIKS
jgi:hypothetical protein